ncbi:MAG: hypothetical protein IKK75_09260 [Clostridia bacterium]|nr:hypothetical protein [Clostridia bacterium]
MTYKNHEGYADPTAGQALANIRREERAAKQREGMRLAYSNGAPIPPTNPDIPHKPKKKRPPRSEQRAKQKANKAKGRSDMV